MLSAELTRLAQTLLHVPNLHWVLAEDIRDCSSLIPTLVERYGIPYTYIVSPLPEMYKRLPKKESPRGVSSRRAALNKILEWHNQTTCADQQAGTIISPFTSTEFYWLFISRSCILWWWWQHIWSEAVWWNQMDTESLCVSCGFNWICHEFTYSTKFTYCGRWQTNCSRILCE